jgi:hypothetical protein
MLEVVAGYEDVMANHGQLRWGSVAGINTRHAIDPGSEIARPGVTRSVCGRKLDLFGSPGETWTESHPMACVQCMLALDDLGYSDR